MNRRSLALRVFLFVCAALAVGLPVGCIGCRNDPEPAGEIALRAAFPEQAALVLEATHGLTAAADGFELALPAEARPARLRRLSLRLPSVGREALRFVLDDGLVVQVREDGAAETAGTLAGKAVAYAREDGASFWTATEAGYEEWIQLDADATSAEWPAVTWQIEGAKLRESPRGVELTDENGVARLAVEAPAAYVASGRPVEVRLAARGQTLELWVDGGGEPVLADPVWYALASMSVGRANHTATLLQDGRVLVTGGRGPSPASSTAEIYDPLTDTWTLTGTLNVPRLYHTATLLQDGKVLVAGGSDVVGKFSEVYDPVTGVFTLTPPGAGDLPRERHTATLLGNGKVLVAGGKNFSLGTGTSLTSVSLYDPAMGKWANAAMLATARRNHTAVLLQDGRVLVAGGYTGSVVPNGSHIASAEIYNPATGTWSAAAAMPYSREDHVAGLLPDGKVIVVGGYSDQFPGYLPFTEVYDPATNTWTAKANMWEARVRHAGVLLWNDRFLVMGGRDSASYLSHARFYDPATNVWSNLSYMLSVPRTSFTATRLPNNTVLVAGGFNIVGNPNGNYLASAVLYFPNTLGVACLDATDCQTGFCADGVCCNAACDQDACDACSVAAGAPANGICTTLPGGACNDGDACTQTDSCQSGLCVGSNPVVCPLNPCQDSAVCLPATGACQYTNKWDGIACDDSSLCTSGDSCMNGVCGGTPVACPAPNACQLATTCDPVAGCLPHPAKPDGIPCNDNSLCGGPDVCMGGTCVGQNPVVCPAPDQCHLQGTCLPFTGVCTDPQKPNGTGCDDGNLCITGEACQNGSCVGGSPVQCPAPDGCHGPGACNPATGACESGPSKPDGVACNDGNSCTQVDVCQSGVCMGSGPVVCPAPDACHEAGVCNPASGACVFANKPEGTLCSDGNSCTLVDACVNGACVGSSSVACPAPAACHEAGVCDPASGVCAYATKADGASCSDGDACTASDACQGGACVAGKPVSCADPGPCQNPGACDPATGACTFTNKPDGTECAGGTCMSGDCTKEGTGGAGGGSTSGTGGGSTSSTGGAGGGGASSAGSSGGGNAGAGGADGGTGGNSAGSSGGGNAGAAGADGGAGGNGSGSSGGSAPMSTGSGASDGGGAPGQSGDCGCRTAGSSPVNGLWAGLGLLFVLIRRRAPRRFEAAATSLNDHRPG